MKNYLYDGTFEGFLTCIYFNYYVEEASGIFQKDQYQESILLDFMEVETNVEKSLIVYQAIQSKISDFDLKRIYRVFLSCTADKETKLLKYIVMGFKKGRRISSLHGDPIVFDIQSAEIKVTTETHRLLGLIRFSMLEDQLLYAPIDPDNDVVEFLAGHFADRLKNDPFIIHDTGRSKAIIARDGRWYISQFTKNSLPGLSEDEEAWRQLWRNYFDTIAIKERTNPRCQKTFMPVRYWKNLTEMT